MDHYLVFKSLHVIAMVAWFAGLFYMPRLLIYFAEAEQRPTVEKNILQEQFKIMQRRLWYGITLPASLMTGGFASYLMFSWNPRDHVWLRIKLWLVIGLYLYQLFIHFIFRDQQKNIVRIQSFGLRIINEVATLFLFSIVFLVVMKENIGLVWALASLLGLILILMTGIFLYRKWRSLSRQGI